MSPGESVTDHQKLFTDQHVPFPVDDHYHILKRHYTYRPQNIGEGRPHEAIIQDQGVGCYRDNENGQA